MPCVVRWPGKVAEKSETKVPSYFPDWFPTLTEIAGAELPTTQQLDGINLTGVLKGEKAPQRTEPMIWDFSGYRGIIAIRDGKWKAVRRNVKTKKPKDWELYDLDADRAEANNLAKQHPEIVTRLEAAYLKTRTVEPDFPLPLYDGKSQK